MSRLTPIFARVAGVFAAAVLGLTAPAIGWAQTATAAGQVDIAVTDIAARVAAYTGAAPADCGRFFYDAEAAGPTAAQLETALQCGRDAANRRAPFWLLTGGRGSESWVGQGLLAGPDGVVRRFYYDSAPAGDAAGTTSFETARCWLPGVHTYAGGRLDFECANDVWKLVVNLVTLLIGGVALLFGVPLARRGLAQTASAMMLVAGGIVAVITLSLAYVGAARWITVFPAVVCVMVLLMMSRWAFRRSTVAALLAAIALLPAPAQAQTTSSDPQPLPAAFLGIGGGLASNDAASRMRLYEEGVASQWLIEGGVALAPRVGVGVELSSPSAATAFTTVGQGQAQIAGRQEERVLVGLLRFRLAQSGRFAADVVGGAGVVFQHHESGGCVPAQERCESTSGAFLDERAPVVAGGFDLPMRLGRHLEIVPAARVYHLRRGEHTVASEQDFNLTWQYEWRSSTRAAVVVNARVTW